MNERLVEPVPDRLASNVGRGCPVRVTLLDASTQERAERLMGILMDRSGSELQVECLPGLQAPVIAATATLEVVEQGTVYWARCELTGEASTLSIHLQGPFQVGHRRRHPRLDVKLPVQLLLEDGGLAPAELRDLSAGGASFQTETICTVGAPVRLVLSLGSGFYLRDLSAEVVRVNERIGGYVVAVQFQADSAQIAQLEQWLNRQMAEGGDGRPSAEI
ncbi:MAG TPA: PilZ domain-containing protein [Symbiobacteriaceae bacterium]|nr:PilZ domain-containing protein [Symbiobacteriaceae bacterium]